MPDEKSEVKRRSSARLPSEILQDPRPISDPNAIDRDAWIKDVVSGFVAHGTANKAYYQVVLEALWPPGHGLPGPRKTEDELRDAIDAYRRALHTGESPYRNYVDTFRRIREMYGEEGITGLIKSGKTYQLIHPNIGPKKIPRTGLDKKRWNDLLAKHNSLCSVCGKAASQLQPDHRKPRQRGGDDELENWQPLCKECNNLKSTACRGCDLDCSVCPWAFPETHAPLRLNPDSIEKIRKRAVALNMEPSALLNDLISKLNFD